MLPTGQSLLKAQPASFSNLCLGERPVDSWLTAPTHCYFPDSWYNLPALLLLQEHACHWHWMESMFQRDCWNLHKSWLKASRPIITTIIVMWSSSILFSQNKTKKITHLNWDADQLRMAKLESKETYSSFNKNRQDVTIN